MQSKCGINFIWFWTQFSQALNITTINHALHVQDVITYHNLALITTINANLPLP